MIAQFAIYAIVVGLIVAQGRGSSLGSPERPCGARLTATATLNRYSIELCDLNGITVAPQAIHVDRKSLDGTLEATDIATIGGPAYRSSSRSTTWVVPLKIAPTMLRTGMQQLVVRFDPSVLTRADSSAVPTEVGTSPTNVFLPDRAHDGELRQIYSGATVYRYGNFNIPCDPDVTPQPQSVRFGQPEIGAQRVLHIVRIERESGSAALLRSGFLRSNGVETAFEYTAIDPLRITFDAALDVKPGTIFVTHFEIPDAIFEGMTRGGADVTQSIREQINKHGCRRISLQVADAWDLELLLSTTAPQSPIGDSSEVGRGMTHADVAFRLGFPSVFATREELNRQSIWDYSEPGPFRSKVVFSGDRVERYEPPGQLP